MVKIHGNWCGPNWTGGKNVSASKYRGSWTAKATDSLDRACRSHDRRCSTRGKLGCCAGDDAKLIVSALKIATNPINILFKPSLVAKAVLIGAAMELAALTRKC
jgi:hypothetical protein